MTRDTDRETHAAHDVRAYDGGSETRYWCATCRRGWSEMRIDEYAREYATEEAA